MWVVRGCSHSRVPITLCFFMRGATEKILDILQHNTETAVNLFRVMATDRSTSYRRARRTLFYGPPQSKINWADWYREQQSFYSILNRLKRDGFIRQEQKRRNSAWHITRSGAEKLQKLKIRNKGLNLPSPAGYTKNDGKQLIIISFDIIISNFHT